MNDENLIKAELHAHTSGVSFCSEVPPEDLPAAYAAKGIKTVVLTNHYYEPMTRYGKTTKEQMKVYLREYEICRDAGKSVGVDILLGAEIAISADRGSKKGDFLLFGVTADFLRDSGCLYQKTQKELYKLCSDANILVYQAHPFRVEHGHSPADPEFMDGIEVNGHPYFLRNEDKVYAFADKYDLGISGGSDFHMTAWAGLCGTLIPASVDSPEKLADFLRTNKRPRLFW